MNTNNEAVLEQLIALITQGNAHITFDDAVKNIPFNILGEKPGNLPYSIWQIVEHIRIAQSDILDFSINSEYKTLQWPDEYWISEGNPANEAAWQNSLKQIQNDRNEFIQLLTDNNTNLYEPFPYGQGQNLFREALLIADHTSYHTGQIILIRRLLNNWG